MNKKYIKYYINLFLDNSKIKNKISTYSNYYYLINKRILPYFNNIKINNINNELIINYVNYLIHNNLSNKTIKDIISIIKQIFKLANINIDIPTPKIHKKEIIIFSKEDQLLLENFLLNNLNYINLGIYLCLYTGLRIGEICALKWEDIDLINNKIYIKNTLIRVKSNEQISKTCIMINNPKSDSSIRIIPIPYFVKDILKEFNNTDNDNYFLTGTNKYIEPRLLYNKYKKILKELNINKYNFHSLRHTFATRCIEMGGDIKTLSLLLGHKNIQLTLNTYIHPSYDDKVNFMNNLKPLI